MLGVRVDHIQKETLKKTLTRFLFDGLQHRLFTPNPEMLVMAVHDKAFREILNVSDLNVADGFGLVLASRFLEHQPLERITGIETLELLADVCTKEGKKLLLLGGAPGVTNQAAQKLRAQAIECGVIEYKNERWQMDAMLLEHIRHEAPDVLAVALGHGKQERFIHDFLHELPSVKIGIGVGGALDYLSGNIPRAPRLMRNMGLEWLFRLVREPKRLPRIWVAVVVFPWYVIRAKLKSL